MLLLLFLVLGLFLFVYAGLLLFYRKAWKRIPVTGTQYSPVDTRISVIIPARNEAGNIERLLHSISHQQYASHLFEVIVVDDHSTDKTAGIVKAMAAKAAFSLKLISLKNEFAGNVINAYKKKAIETGIAQSNGELIVTTDADCFVQPLWLSTIASVYEKNKPAIIVMPVAIDCRLRFIEIFQALDFMTLQGITGAGVQQKLHSMGNGANLAYTRNAFESVNGFTGIDHIASGDDMLLLHKIRSKFPGGVHYIKAKEVIVYTQPVVSVGDFFQQRIRWASKAGSYEDKSLFPVLLVVYLLNLLLLLTPFASFLYDGKIHFAQYEFPLLPAWLLLLLIKTIVELYFLYPVAVFFGKQKLLWLFPLMQPFHIVYTVVAGFLGKFGAYRWKERKVK